MHRHNPSSAPTGISDAPGSQDSAAPKPRVLVVEDQALIALALAADLTEMGCDVVGRAVSGEAAVELAWRLVPDTVIMDVNLTGAMDGIEAAARIREARAPRLIFVTAYTDGPDRRRMEALGPVAILAKPYHPSELNLAVNVAARRRLRGPSRAFAAAGG